MLRNGGGAQELEEEVNLWKWKRTAEKGKNWIRWLRTGRRVKRLIETVPSRWLKTYESWQRNLATGRKSWAWEKSARLV